MAATLGFFRSGFRAWDQTAALFPSSRYLVRALTDHPELRRARVVVELGPGTGAVTRAILHRLPADARLLAVEIDAAMARRLEDTLPDPRLRVIHGSAADLPAILAAEGVFAPVDAVISGLGMSLLLPEIRDAVLAGVTRVLADDGVFAQFAYLHARAVVWSPSRGLSHFSIRPYLAPHFGRLDRRLVGRNLPPAAVYACRRPRRPPPARLDGAGDLAAHRL